MTTARFHEPAGKRMGEPIAGGLGALAYRAPLAGAFANICFEPPMLTATLSASWVARPASETR